MSHLFLCPSAFSSLSLVVVLAGCGSSSSSSDGSDAGAAAGDDASISTSDAGSGTSGSTMDGSTNGDDSADGSVETRDGSVGSACHQNSECSTSACGVTNLPPVCGGTCDPTRAANCAEDSDCADASASMICDLQGPCACGGGGVAPQLHCTKGCTADDDCGAGSSCNTLHRCVATTCNAPADCGSKNFTCTSNDCTAASCTADSDCDGFCVDGSCSATAGTCQPPPVP